MGTVDTVYEMEEHGDMDANGCRMAGGLRPEVMR